MTGSRYDKMALGTTYINKLAAHSNNPFAKAKEELMKSGHAAFVAAYNGRESTRKARAEAVKQLDVTDKELITLLSKISKIILADIPRTDPKIKDFFINGTVSDIIAGNNLIADILPPPNYIIESYLMAYELLYYIKEEKK